MCSPSPTRKLIKTLDMSHASAGRKPNWILKSGSAQGDSEERLRDVTITKMWPWVMSEAVSLLTGESDQGRYTGSAHCFSSSGHHELSCSLTQPEVFWPDHPMRKNKLLCICFCFLPFAGLNYLWPLIVRSFPINSIPSSPLLNCFFSLKNSHFA